MNPKAIMYSNKILHQKEVERRQRLHRQALATVKPTSQTHCKTFLDRSTPVSMGMAHMKFNPKKLRAEQDRLERIRVENEALLKRMYAIMRSSVGGEAVEYGPGVRINKNQVPVTDSYVSTRSLVKGGAQPLESLSFERRARAQEEIMRENEAILRRINSAKAEYDHKKWADERAKTEEYMRRLAKDDTAGYLPQSKDGHSIYFKPGSSSKSRRLPSLSTPSVSSHPSAEFVSFLQTSTSGLPTVAHMPPSRGGKRKGNGRRTKATSSGAKPAAGLDSPSATVTDGAGAGSAGDGDGWLRPSSSALRPVASFTFAPPSGDVSTVLEFGEVPSNATDATITGLVVSAGSSAQLRLPMPEVLAIVASSSLDNSARAAMHRLAPADDASRFPSLADNMSDSERQDLARVICRRLSLHDEGSGITMTLRDSE